MALKKQSIRRGMHITANGKEISKEEIISTSEEWNEIQENFFRKMLKQGGKFKVKGVSYEIKTQEQILTSKGEKDGGVIQLPGDDVRF